MKFLLAVFMFLCGTAGAQAIYDGFPMDSSIIRFDSGAFPGFVADTAAHPLWQMGRTHKAFFTADTAGAVGIMTDTLSFYPQSADNSFVLKLHNDYNMIFDVWHRFQTDSTHAGGLIEYSMDNGTSWQNITGDCNIDSFFTYSGVKTHGCYSHNDTLFNGMAGFTGTDANRFSRIQFFWGFPMKSTTTGCDMYADSLFLRFRFVSDSTVDTLAGWMIDSIRVERDFYPGSVNNIAHNELLKVYPNPSANGIFYFEHMAHAERYRLTVYDVYGRQVYDQPYSDTLSLKDMAAGIYYCRVWGPDSYYCVVRRD